MSIFRMDNFSCGLSLLDATLDASLNATHLTGSRSLYFSTSAYADISFGSKTKLGGYFMMQNIGAGSVFANSPYIAFKAGSTIQMRIHMYDSRVHIYDGAGTWLATAAASFVTGSWAAIGFEIYIHDSLGYLKVYVDDIEAVTFGGDTNAGAGYIDNIRLDLTGVLAGGLVDSYVLDTEDKPDAMNILTMVPDTDAAPNELTPSAGSDHYAVVDDDPTDASDYLYGDVAGKEMFGRSSWSGVNDIIAVQVNAVSVRDAGAPGYLIPVLRSGGIDYDGDDSEIPTTNAKGLHHCWVTDPLTSLAFASMTGKAFGFRIY